MKSKLEKDVEIKSSKLASSEALVKKLRNDFKKVKSDQKQSISSKKQKNATEDEPVVSTKVPVAVYEPVVVQSNQAAAEQVAIHSELTFLRTQQERLCQQSADIANQLLSTMNSQTILSAASNFRDKDALELALKHLADTSRRGN
jgi:hypothetical protein